MEGKNGRPWKRSAIDRESTGAHQQDPVLTAGFEVIIRTIRLSCRDSSLCADSPSVTRWYRRIDTNVSSTESAAFVIETPRQQSDAMLTLIIEFRVHSRVPISADFDDGFVLRLHYDINRTNLLR